MKSRTFQPFPCLDVIQMARLLQNTSNILHLCYLMIRQRYWPVVLVDACKLVFSISVIAKNLNHVVSFNGSDKHLITREYFGGVVGGRPISTCFGLLQFGNSPAGLAALRATYSRPWTLHHTPKFTLVIALCQRRRFLLESLYIHRPGE